ncbi:uncharacterized protein LOC105661941 [Megachile rotundata]|uniref:uncharacterized protein LOC105661941 n=1 Tax=Megachile rotundata TaxID=143995 RepID=UPI003FCFF794
MLITKFIAPVTRKFHVGIPNVSLRNSLHSNNVSQRKPQDIKKALAPSKCEEYRDKLAKCPKPRKRQKWQFFQPKPKVCKVESVADNYKKARQEIADRTKLILTNFQDESRSVLDKFKKNLEISKNVEEKQLDELSNDVKKKVQKLIVLNPPFGSCKRKSIMLFEYRNRQAFNELQCGFLPQIRRVQYIIDNSQRDIQVTLDRARSLILSCRKCKDHEALKKCIEEKANYAEKILDKTSQNMKLNLDKIDKIQLEILEYHKEIMAEFMKEYRKKNKELLEHLDNCIYNIKNKR